MGPGEVDLATVLDHPAALIELAVDLLAGAIFRFHRLGRLQHQHVHGERWFNSLQSNSVMDHPPSILLLSANFR